MSSIKKLVKKRQWWIEDHREPNLRFSLLLALHLHRGYSSECLVPIMIYDEVGGVG